jgi:hypothetical protein
VSAARPRFAKYPASPAGSANTNAMTRRAQAARQPRANDLRGCEHRNAGHQSEHCAAERTRPVVKGKKADGLSNKQRKA